MYKVVKTDDFLRVLPPEMIKTKDFLRVLPPWKMSCPHLPPPPPKKKNHAGTSIVS